MSPFFAKLFEHCILDKHDYLLLSNYLQFSFRKHSSCSNAMFVLRQVADFFCKSWQQCEHGIAGPKKAFDHVYHLKLFHALSDRKIPFFII